MSAWSRPSRARHRLTRGPGGEGDAPYGRRRPRHRPLAWYTELLLIVGIVLAGSLLLKAFVVQAFWIPSGSMEPTLRVNDRVLVDKLSYRLGPIRRGDVVVFDGLDSFTPEAPVPARSGLARLGHDLAAALGLAGTEHDFVKRVIGLPGDRVTCCDARDRITVNGIALTEDYLYPDDVPSRQPFDIAVPPGRLWVMGDHRGVSADSRAHLGDPGGGTVPTEKVIGKAVLVVWPVKHWARLPRPHTFGQPGLGMPAVPAVPAPVVGPLALAGAVSAGTTRRGSTGGSGRH